MKSINEIKNNKKAGFTLLEMIVVIAILAVLVALSSSSYTKYVQKAELIHIQADTKTVSNVYKSKIADINELPADDLEMNIDKELLKDKKIYNEKGLLKEEIDVPLHLVKKTYCSTKLPGTFFIDDNGNGFYVNEVVQAYAPNEQEPDDQPAPSDDEYAIEFKDKTFEKDILHFLNNEVRGGKYAYLNGGTVKVISKDKTKYEDKVSKIMKSDVDKITFLEFKDGSINNDTKTDLSNFKNLQKINLAENTIDDLRFLSSNKNLDSIEANMTTVKSWDGINNFKNLKFLAAYSTNLSDLNAFKDCKSLETLSVSQNNITDISALKNLTNLKSLVLAGNNIKDYSALNNLKNLESLYVSDINDETFNNICNLSKIKTLSVGTTTISDLSNIAKLSSLEELAIQTANTTDISTLKNLNNLKYLTLSRKDKDKYDKDVIKTLTGRGVEIEYI